MDRRAEAVQTLIAAGVTLGRWYVPEAKLPPNGRKQCDGKKPFTEKRARKASRWKNFDRLHAYKCELCPWWHVGGGVK
jgi:hypothetical protein